MCSRSLDRAKAFAEKHGAASGYDDYTQMLHDPNVDVVYIASPNGLHAEQALAALECGKRVARRQTAGTRHRRRRADHGRTRPPTQACGWASDFISGTGDGPRCTRCDRGRTAVARCSTPRWLAARARPLSLRHLAGRARRLQAAARCFTRASTRSICVAYLCDQPVVEVTCMIDSPGAEDVFVGSCRLARRDAGVNIASHSRRAGTRPDWTVFGTGDGSTPAAAPARPPTTSLTCIPTAEPVDSRHVDDIRLRGRGGRASPRPWRPEPNPPPVDWTAYGRGRRRPRCTALPGNAVPCS